MSFVEAADGTRLHYTVFGSGSPVVFVHSWGQTSSMWDYQVPDLTEAGLRCLLFDRRGHGRSDRPGSGYDLDTLADDLAALLTRLDLHEVTLVGHSMGCSEIVRCLSRHGTRRIARAALIAPTLPCLIKGPDNPDGIDRAYVDANAAALRQDVARWCEDNALPFFGKRAVSAGMVQWVIRQLVDTPLQILLSTLRANSEADFRAELPGLRLPTLILHGDCDASAPLALTGQKAAALIPGSRLVVYEGAGHGLCNSDHARVNADLRSFIAG
jgi:pimeloyl-ACP methyl ester carboxylesterase